MLIFYASYLDKYEELRDSLVAFGGVYSNKKVNNLSYPAWKITFYLTLKLSPHLGRT